MFTQHDIEWDDTKVARLWDYYSAREDTHYFSELHGGDLLEATGLPLTAPLRHLDFGCGTGFLWDHLKRLRAGWRYTGIDFSERSVGTVQAKATGDPRFEQAFHIRSLPTPLQSESYDVVTIIEVVEHLTDEYLVDTLTEATRLLKADGYLVISTPNAERLEDNHKFCPDCGSVFHEWQHVRSWTQESLGKYVSNFGYEVERAVITDFGAVGIARRAAAFARRLLERKHKDPHLMIVFRKKR